jgi:hypothetical protein
MTQEPVFGLATQSYLVREMIDKNAEIYVEEIARIILKQEKEQAAATLAYLWGFASKINVYMAFSTEGLTKIWEKVRDDKHLSDVIFATAQKLRGLYTADEWETLIANQAAGASLIARGGKSVADGASLERFPTAESAKALLKDNQWVIPILLMNYVNLTNLPDHIKLASVPVRKGTGVAERLKG